MMSGVRVDQTADSTRVFISRRGGRRLMGDRSFRQDLQGFALELRQLAYTMPPGHEDRLIHLSERMVARSRQSRGIDSRGA